MESQRTLVAGSHLTRSLADFERSCESRLAEEQEKLAPDNHLIAVLCDAVRLSREHTAASRLIPVADLQDAVRYRFLRDHARAADPAMDGSFAWYVPSVTLRSKARTFDEAVDAAMGREHHA